MKQQTSLTELYLAANRGGRRALRWDRLPYNRAGLMAWGTALIGAAMLALLYVLPTVAAHPAPATRTSASASKLTVVESTASALSIWTGHGVDARWSNPDNWQGGIVPTAADTVRFPTGLGSDSIIDAHFDGTVASLILEAGFAGRVQLERDLAVQGEIVLAGGELQQGGFELATTTLTQHGGHFRGGTARLLIADAARVTKGLFMTPAATMDVRTLEIGAAATVRLAANGKLNITGDGMALTGSGTLDTLSNRPNSVELTGKATSDLMAAQPMADYQALLAQPLPAELQAAQRAAAQGRSLTLPDEFNFWAAAIDAEQGFAYFGAWTKPGTIVKVRLSDFSRVGALTLDAGEDGLRSAVSDAQNGYVYFGTYTSPGKVIKINLETFTREDALTLAQGDNNLTAAVIDPLQKFAYFGTDTKPGRVVKINLSSFSRVGGLPLNTGEDFLKSAVIDVDAGFAYFGTDTTPGNIVKINLGNFTRETGRKLSTGQDFLISAVIDPAAGFAYFGTDSSPGKVIKLKLDDFSVVRTLTFNPGERSLASAVIDPQNGFAYFGTRTKPGMIVTVKLENFTRVNAQTLGTNEDYLNAAVIDLVNGFVYFGTGFDTADAQYTEFNQPGVIIRINTTTAFLQSASLRFPGEDGLVSAVIDDNGEFAYFGTDSNPGVIVKIRTADNTRVAALTLEPDEDQLTSAVIDPLNGFAYFGTDTAPGKVIKVKLSNFTRVASLTLNTDEDRLASAVIDAVAGFAYFGTRTTPGRVVKVQLSDLTRVGALTLNTEEKNLAAAVIDTQNGFAYFGTDNSPGIVIKIKLADFTRDSALTLESGERQLSSAVIDTTGEVSYAYFGTRTTPGIVVKLKLNDFTRQGALRLSGQGRENLLSAVIDPAKDRAYFGTAPDSGRGNGRVVAIRLSDLTFDSDVELNSSEDPLTAAVINMTTGHAFFGNDTDGEPGKIIKVKLDPLTRESGLRLSKAAFNFWSSVIDSTNGFAYFGTWSQPGVIAKIRLADFTRVGTLTLENGEDGLRSAVLDPLNGFAYFGTYTSPGKVVKINLQTFTREGVLSLASGDDELTSAVIDPQNGFAYFGTDTSPGRVVKINLATFTREAAVILNSGEDFLTSAVIDLVNGHAYFGTHTIPGIVVKLELAGFSRLTNLQFQSGENFLDAAIIDPQNGFAYFGTNTMRGQIVKVKLSGLTRERAQEYGTEQARFASAVVDPQNGLGYFGTQTQPGRVIKINLETLTLIDTIALKNPKEDFLTSAVIDLANNTAYFGTGYSEADLLYEEFNKPGIVAKISLNQRTDAKKSTTTALTSSPNPAAENQTVVFTATVSADDGTPTGDLHFFANGTSLSGDVALNNGVATFTTASLPPGTHIITATYAGDGDYASSVADPLEQVVNQANKVTTTITVTVSSNPAVIGQQVIFTAVVTITPGTAVMAAGGTTPPTGQVQFYVDGEKMGSPRTLNNGVARTAYNKFVENRTYAVTASYLGDSQYSGSDSTALTQLVQPDDTPTKSESTTTLTATPNPSTVGQAVTLKATVVSNGGNPDGTVTFLEGSTVLGTAQLDGSGVATLNLTTLTVGNHTISARYEGTASFNSSTSATLPQIVTGDNEANEQIYLPIIACTDGSRCN